MEIVLSENYVTVSNYNILYYISFFSVFFSLYIVISKNPIISILFLIGLFFSVSIYLISIGLHFIGLVYLIVYVGAVSILFLFILMLINVRISELLTDTSNNTILALLTVISINFIAQDILPFNILYYDTINSFDISSYTSFTSYMFSSPILSSANDIYNNTLNYFMYMDIAVVNSKSWDSILVSLSHITSIGNILYTNFIILFIIMSLILLLAMIGSIIITINKSKIIYTSSY